MEHSMYDRSRRFAQVVGAKGGQALNIAVAIEPALVDLPTCQLIALALCDLLPRISERYSRIDFIVPDVRVSIPRLLLTRTLGNYLVERALAIAPWGQFRAVNSSVSQYDFVVSIGRVEGVLGRRVLYAMSSGWRCFVTRNSSELPRPKSFNAFSCLATASLAAAWIYREAEGLELPFGEDEVGGWSLLTYEKSEQDGPELPATVDVGTAFEAGLGGTGNALLWAMRFGPALMGKWVGYEHEALEDTNNNRYLLMTLADAVDSKVALAAKMFAGFHPDLDFQPCERDVREAYGDVFTATVVLATVDDPGIRVDLQRHGADVLLNVGTNSQYLSMSRHTLRSIEKGSACVQCLYGEPERMARRQRESTVSFVIGLVGAVLGGELVKNYAFPEFALQNTWMANIFSATSGRVMPRGADPQCSGCSGMKGGRDE